MTESWFERLEDEVRHAAGHFRHASPTIAAGEPQAPQPSGAPMALADTAATLQTSHASLKAELQEMLAKGHDALDNRMTQIDAAIGDVAAVASIADNPLVAAAAGALHCPPEVLEGFVNGLTALAKAFPKQAAAEAPSEPAPEPQAA